MFCYVMIRMLTLLHCQLYDKAMLLQYYIVEKFRSSYAAAFHITMILSHCMIAV